MFLSARRSTPDAASGDIQYFSRWGPGCSAMSAKEQPGAALCDEGAGVENPIVNRVSGVKQPFLESGERAAVLDGFETRDVLEDEARWLDCFNDPADFEREVTRVVRAFLLACRRVGLARDACDKDVDFAIVVLR